MGWKLPFNLAVLFHVLLVSSALIIPKYIHTRPKLPDFTSVNLVNIADLAPPAPVKAPPPAQTPAKPVLTNKVPKAAPTLTAPIAEIVEPPPEATPAKAISIKPLKRKLKKKIPPGRSTEDIEKKRLATERKRNQARQDELEARSQRLQEEAKRQKALADEEAIAASKALSALKESLRADAAATPPEQTNNRSGGSSTVLEAQYFASIFGHLHQYWKPPEIRQWDSKLLAVVVITIAQNGRVINHKFESRSGDRVFDQFVSRAIQEANPLPAIPKALRKQQLSLGLKFRPGQIQ